MSMQQIRQNEKEGKRREEGRQNKGRQNQKGMGEEWQKKRKEGGLQVLKL